MESDVFNRSPIIGNKSSTRRSRRAGTALVNANFRLDAGGQLCGAPASMARVPSIRIIPLPDRPVKNLRVPLDWIGFFAGRRRAFLGVQDA